MKRLPALTSFFAAHILAITSMSASAGNSSGPMVALCDPRTPGCSSIVAAPVRHSLAPNRPVLIPSRLPEGGNLPGGSLTLQGELSGEWDSVDVNLVFTYDFTATNPTIGVLQVFVRGWPGVRDGSSNRYRAQWDRAAYWIDFDGNGSGAPKLLPASELAENYVPAAGNDPYPDLASNPAVIAACTIAHPCTVQFSPYVLLREAGVDYSAYPDLAAQSDLLFVANDLGQAVTAVVDIYDENEEFVETKPLTAGDAIELSVQAYKLGEPQFMYLVDQMDFTTLQNSTQIQLANYVPGVDFEDPFLPANLNAGSRRLKVMLDAYRVAGNTFAFGGPFDLGFTWSQALDVLYQNSYESPQSSPQSAPTIVHGTE